MSAIAPRVRVDDALYRECVDFLVDEAEILDNHDVRAWLELCDPEIEYLVPVRLTRERTAGAGFTDRSFHMKEDYGSLEMRVRRLETEYAWAEDPPSRMRRFVSNFRITRGEAEDEVEARTNLLIFRGRYDSSQYDIITAERHDVLRRADGELRLLRRNVLMDYTTVGTHNLAFFF
jgi:ethylbenzene dioxygenase subunit beta